MLSFPMYEDFRDNFVDRMERGANDTREPPRRQRGARALRSSPACSPPAGRDSTSASNGQTERVPGELVSGTYFEVLGVGAALGRVITPDDDAARGGGMVAVLSYDYWRTRFGSDPHIVGKTIADQQLPASRSSACRRPASTASTSAMRRAYACR